MVVFALGFSFERSAVAIFSERPIDAKIDETRQNTSFIFPCRVAELFVQLEISFK